MKTPWSACDGAQDRPREACGVFGIWAPGMDVAQLTCFGLLAMQHRGQESAGIAAWDGHAVSAHRGMGLVAQVFDAATLAQLEGLAAIGHTRYATSGAAELRNAQPLLLETRDGPLGVAHNGNLIDAEVLRQRVLDRGVGLASSSDTEIIAQLLAEPLGTETPGRADWGARLARLMTRTQGAYSLAILTREGVFGARDPWGFRPLCVGEFFVDGEARGWALASESCALETIGARLVREVAPGECVRLDARGITTVHRAPKTPQRALCSFELVYFSRPDSRAGEGAVHAVRERMGWTLAQEAPCEADVVVGVPDSALPAALGYARGSALPYREGILKNHHTGRTFIMNDEATRARLIRLKYSPLRDVLCGQRVVLLDDSIVRGSTAGPLVRLLREAGAREVHVRVASPPILHPCFMGVDMATRDELIAHRLGVEGLAASLGADSLAFLSREGMQRAIEEVTGDTSGLCDACFSGRYPIALPSRAPVTDEG